MPVAPPEAEPRPLRVGLLGLGTVGGAVAARLVDDVWRDVAAAHGTPPPELMAVGVRDPSRPRRVTLPPAVERTDDLAALVERDDIDIVVELLGGLEPAASLVQRALERGTAVVTANKALLAELGPALERTARRSGASLRFEAAAAGGIPVLAPLARDLAANRIESIRGIVNGTTNFILSAMDADRTPYEAALAEAQRQGYAEADPSADVTGRDAAHKLVLLGRQAFGTWIQPSAVGRAPACVDGDGPPGITGVGALAVTAAAERGLVIKLVASLAWVQGEAGSRLVGSVEPWAVVRDSVIGSTDGVINAVEIAGEPVGRLAFRGPGAGGDATSSAVLGDLLALARGEGSTWAALREALPVGQLDGGRTLAGRWLWAADDGRSGLTAPLPLEEARRELVATGLPSGTALYRVLEGDA